MKDLPKPRASASIRDILLRGTLALLIAVLGSAAWLGYEAALDEADELFDARLATSARVLERLVAHQLEFATVEEAVVIELPHPLEAHDEHLQDASPLGHSYETKIAFQVWDGERLLARSSSAPAQPFAPLDPGFSEPTLNGHDWRVFSLQSERIWIQVAERDDVRGELSQKVALAAIGPSMIGTLILLALLAGLIRYGLSPLGELADRIRARRADSLAPIGLERTPEEIAPVLSALNHLFARMGEALERERRFTDAAAHELRTPLASIKIHAENLARATTPEQREASAARMLQGLERTIHLTTQMLDYSRASAAPHETFARLDLRAVVDEARELLQHELQAAGQQVAWRCEGDTTVHGDATRLLTLVRNLLDNAGRYAPPGSRIDVELARQADGSLRLSVDDEGPGIAPELRERVFESYFRVPGSGAAGSGLGLAIVRAVADQHAARVRIDTGRRGHGTAISVLFPPPPTLPA